MSVDAVAGSAAASSSRSSSSSSRRAFATINPVAKLAAALDQHLHEYEIDVMKGQSVASIEDDGDLKKVTTETQFARLVGAEAIRFDG